MTDTESSISGGAMSLELEKSVIGDEICSETIAIPQASQSNQEDEKLEEFSKLLKSMLESRNPSEEEIVEEGGEGGGEGEGGTEDVENVITGTCIKPLSIESVKFRAFTAKLGKK